MLTKYITRYIQVPVYRSQGKLSKSKPYPEAACDQLNMSNGSV